MPEDEPKKQARKCVNELSFESHSLSKNGNKSLICHDGFRTKKNDAKVLFSSELA